MHIMEINLSPHLLLLLLLFLTLFTATNPTTAPPPLPPSQIPQLSTQEINNIINALIGAGDTSANQWASILSMSNPSLSLTLFVPQDAAATAILDPTLFPYHVVPQRLTFSDLLLFPLHSRLPTLLPGKSIAVTGNSAANYSVDGTLITHPDLYNTPSLAVHGVKSLLDYSLFSDGLPPTTPFLPIGTPWSSAAAAPLHGVAFFFPCFAVLQLFLMLAW
ncbi:FAS1 domain-containing protein SELMODRAFT_448915-like [Lotus japonicus]|uniref:FAS1 domain-containing protein SELMODRAFT_448915-like n=1 Tax=Lotus japonicus TaxID=34305 RepID=UPI0025896C19|nr:FAS1 domain-containing protein SELMODRAFT_448915-like [Lotus japonicus]